MSITQAGKKQRQDHSDRASSLDDFLGPRLRHSHQNSSSNPECFWCCRLHRTANNSGCPCCDCHMNSM